MATRAGKARTDVELDGQLDLFDGVPDRPLPIGADQLKRRNGEVDTFAAEIVHRSERAGVGRHADADRAVLRALEEALADAREAGDDRPTLVVLHYRLGLLGAPSTPVPAQGGSLRQAGDDWLRRLETQQKSESTLVGYRVAIDDLLDWSTSSLRARSSTTCTRTRSERNRRRRATTGASSSCASSCAGSAGATASATRSSISMRRPSPTRSATG